MISALALLALTQANTAEVKIFVMEDCPIARKYAPELERLRREFEPKAVNFTLVQVDPHSTKESATKWAREYGLKMSSMLDPKHALAKRFGVTNVPTAVVTSQGATWYVGRIDDRFPSLGVDRTKSSHHDLKQALGYVLSGKPHVLKRTKAIGCALPTL